MKYRRATILAQQDVSTAGTKTQDISLTDPISRIYVKFNPKNDGHDATAHPAKCVSKIEVVDGSDVLMSLSGMQAEALHFYNTGECRGKELEYRNDCSSELLFALDFGRFLYDPRLALDPKKFANPQIKVTHDKSLGGSAPDSATLEIFADVFDESPPTPDGFLTAREWYSFALADDAYEYIDLPVDRIIRKLMILSLVADKSLQDQIAEIRLSEDNDKRLPVDMNMVDLMRIAAQHHGEYHEELVGMFSGIAQKDWYITPSNTANTQVSPISNDGVVQTSDQREGGYVSVVTDKVCVWRGLIHGFEPHGAVPIDFGRQDDPDDWFDVAALGALQLRLKGGSSVGDPSTSEQVIQQYRKY